MKRQDFLMKAYLMIFDKFMKEMEDITKYVSDMENYIINSQDNIDERILKVHSDAYQIISFIQTENLLLKNIFSELSKLPNNAKTKKIKFEMEDFIDDNLLFNINRIKVPTIETFESIVPIVRNLMLVMINFSIDMVLKSTADNMDIDYIVDAINDKIQYYISIYEDMKFISVDSKDGKSKDVKNNLKLNFDSDSQYTILN